jgi:hypothetical protein
MKFLAALLLASLPAPQVQSPKAQPHFAQQAYLAPHKGGKWYLARTGHAVYCYGPVMTLSAQNGGIERVATFCRGDRLLIPLKD